LTHLFGTAIFGWHHAAKGEHSGHVLEHLLGAIAQVDVVGVGELQVFDMALPQFHPGKHQPVRIFIRQRLQEHRVSHAENCGTRAQAERDGHDCDQRKLWTSTKYPNRDPQIA
jgi:hypothetical protein